MLMFWNFVALLSIVCSVFNINIVFHHTVGSFDKIVSEVTVARLGYRCVLAAKNLRNRWTSDKDQHIWQGHPMI